MEYSPKQGVTTLIFGHNTDNESQGSNGSGKSTLIEAIALGITGSPLRKVNSAEIINDAAEECYVQLRFSNTATGERMTIEREIFRKGTSGVIVTLRRGDTQNNVAQPSVDAYNKYILDKLGITRDELFSSFILSRHRYQDFLSSSDKEKKELINRFSNGVLVDQAIDALHTDIEPLQAEAKEMDLELAGLDGRIEMLVDQINAEEESRADKQRLKEDKITEIKETIARKRELVRECEKGIDCQKMHGGLIDEIDHKIQSLEDSEDALDDIIFALKDILAPLQPTGSTDWQAIIQTKKREIDDSQAEIDKWHRIIGTTGQKLAVAEADLIAVRTECEVFEQQAGEKYEAINQEMTELSERQSIANLGIDRWKRRKMDLSTAIESLKAKLAGTIRCPKCEHQFLLSDENFDVNEAAAKLADDRQAFDTAADRLLDSELEHEKVEMMQTHLKNELRTLAADKDQWTDKFQKAQRAVQSAEYELTGFQFNLKRIQDFVAARSTEIDDIRRSIFDEAYGFIDAAYKTNERMITEHKEKRSAASSSIETLLSTIAEIENSSGTELIASLKESLKTYRKKSSQTLERKTALDNRLGALLQQEMHFISFRGHLANMKINALSAMMNRVLEDLGSDLRVNLSGYTTLKSGAVREKISVSIMRDGLDAGSFGKFSEGERARIMIASIVAMQRLVNGNCEIGKGLDLIAIDELADSMDSDGLASVFAALNKLGICSLVVSHGLTSEAYPYRVTICKENGESRIEDR